MSDTATAPAGALAELFDDRREVIDKSAEVHYLATGVDDEAAVRALADDGIPGSIASDAYTLYLREVEIEERVNETSWKIVARYRKPSWSWPEHLSPDSRFAFDTGGGTQHITQSVATVGRYGPKASAKLGGAIGFDGKNVKGCDIVVPVYNFHEVHYFSDDDVTAAYKHTLFELTGTVNDDDFKGFSAGEVLFRGASGSRQGDDPSDLWEITYRFAASPNEDDLEVGDISGIEKEGWQYLWVQYADEADDDTQQLVKKPVAAYVEKVYRYYGDFSALGIGVA